jgi:transcriptional regulator with XRE-family HTH domain
MEKDILERQRENFKSFMKENKLNANSWAKKAGIAEATIRHYLSGRNKSITALNIEKLAEAINVDSEVLLNSSNKKIKDNDIIKIQKDLFVQTFQEVHNFLNDSNIEINPVMHANILLSWYEVAQMQEEDKIDSSSIEPFKELIKKIISGG